MSLEEAKKVTASFSGTAFVPPPRTIADVTAVLDQQKPADLATIAELRAQADREPPKTVDQAALATFYFERGKVARHAGRIRQAIDDLTRAVELGDTASIADQFWYAELARAERDGGEVSRAVEYARIAIDRVSEKRGTLINMNADLAKAYVRAGDIDAAEHSLGTSLALLEESRGRRVTGNPVFGVNESELRAAWTDTVRNAQGDVARARGQFAEAERFYREAIEAARGLPRRYHWAIDAHSADVALMLVWQGRLTEGEHEARAALLGALARQGRYSIRTAPVLTSLAQVLAEQGRHEDSAALLRAAVDINEKVGAGAATYTGALTRIHLGAALGAQRRWKEALSEYEAVRAAFVADPQTFQRYFAGNVNWALALLRTGDIAGAQEQLDIGFERSRRALGPEHPSTAEIRGVRAMVLVAAGQRVEALAEFAAATPILLTRSPEVDDETTTRPARDERLGLILDVYVGLLADVRSTPLETQAGIDATAEAFRVAEAARGRTVQRALDASAARAVAQTPGLTDLVRREQDARKQISALDGMLVNAYSLPTDKQDAKVIERLRGQTATLRRAREVLVEQIKREFLLYAALTDPAPITVSQARAALRRGEALVTTFVSESRTFVWAIPQSGPLAFAEAPIGEAKLAAMIAQLREPLTRDARTVGDIPAFDVTTAHEIYRLVLDPVRRGWEGADTLVVVAHGPLARLPFALLPTRASPLGAESGPLFSAYRRVPWLGRTHAVATLPSAGALVTLRSLPVADPGRRPFVGFGDPYFSVEQARAAATEAHQQKAVALATRATVRSLLVAPGQGPNSVRLGMLPRLPDTAEEVRSIATALRADPAADVFLGERANEQQVKTLDLSRYRVIAFATHGLVPGDLDGLTRPALALTAPEVAKVDGDGLLTMEEILALRLNADWVVLSACDTAASRGAGSEAISGLGRAFFYAGARALLVSNWPVETTSARALTTELFKRQTAQPELSRAKALQQTMNALIDDGARIDAGSGRAVFSYAHPIFWAPFTLVGDPG
jgi:CHAT domain-containing protein/tetratricopeptide (TPR) repeat protein